VGEPSPQLILIVEDDPDVAEAEQIILESAGYRTLLAANAAEGMARLHQQRPVLVLLDVMMPAGTEGFHFVWELRQDSDQVLRETPIIIMTALHRKTKLRFYPEQSDGTYGPYEYLPVQGFLDKPVPSHELLATVKRVLAEQSPSVASNGEA